MPPELILHIAAGGVSLLAGTLAVSSRKGGKIHRLAGKVFYLAMLLVVASALFISLKTNNTFLFCIGIFSLYQNVSGRRVLRNKTMRPKLVDFLITLLGLSNGAFMIYTGNIVLMVFGGISVFLALSDIRTFSAVLSGKSLPPSAWLRKHIGMMLGAYIATITAFLVVNITNVEPAWLIWLAPTFILIPIMLYHFRKVGGK
jgi:uncharacterized membrane protein